VLAGFLDVVGVVPGAFDGAGIGALAPGVEVPGAGDLGDGAFEGALLVRGGKAGSLTRRRMMRTARLNLTRSGSMPAAVAAVQISALIA
jgi:hypothetical protein